MEPTPQEIRDQLERILGSQEFRASERLTDFLRFVTEEALGGRAAGINQRTVAVKGLGFASNFDPLTNPAVRIQAHRLRRALDRYYLTQGTEDPICIEIPKGGYVPVFSPNAGRPQVAEAVSEPEATAPATKDRPPAHLSSPSIAVLQMVSWGSDEAYAYLGSGLTEETVIALTRFPELVVVGPLNRDTLGRKGLGPRGIGREYGVRFVLDGTIRVRGQALRMTAKLTDALSGHQLWGQAHDYDLETSTIKQIDDELVGQVVATIADAYGVIPRALTKESRAQRNDSLSEYEAILRYYHSFYVLTPEAHAEASEALKRALERDPNNAMAAGMLGDLVAATYQYGYDDSEALLDQAEELGRRAVALDPNCQPARFTMALVHFLRFRRRQFIGEAEKCIGLNPNHALNCAALALHLYMAGERLRGVELMERVMRLNPHHPGWYHLVPYMEAYRQGDYEAALIEAQHFNIPVFHYDPIIRVAALGQLGHQEETNQAIDELLALVPDFRTRGRSLIRRFAYLDEHVDMLLEGLRKAGLDVS